MNNCIECPWFESCDELDESYCISDELKISNVLNEIGMQLKIWSRDKKKTATYIQILEIAEQLNDDGKWFIKTLCDYIEGKAESEE